MRTWLIYAIALSTAATACAQAPGQPEISILNSTSIFVRWQWTGDNVGPQDARFEVSAIAGGVDSKNVSVSGKQYIVLDGLTPGKQYEIRAAFVKADQSRIPSDPASITLPQTDLKAPASVKIEAGERSNPLSVPYTVSWEFEADSSEGELTGFKVLYCTVSCDVDDAGSGKKSSKSLNYYTEVTVIVLAIFKGADGATSEIGSTPATVRTVTGQPGPVENLNVEQKRDSLEVNVHWLPPNLPNGEIVAYALEVKAGDFDVITTNIADPKVAEYTYFVTTGEIASKPHDIKVRAINNAEDAFKTGAPAEKQLEIVKPDPPTTVNLTSCTSDTLGISIVRENDGELTFRILYNYNETIETKEQNVVLSGFEAYKDVPVEVSVCLPLEIGFFCGGSNKNVFKTNVGVPSQVRNLTVTAAGNNETSSGTVTLNWLQPETPAGPIDGYVVKIMDKTGGGAEENEVKQVLEYSPSALKNCTQYEFAVMAFNVDLVSHAKVNGSLSEVRSFTTVNCDENGGGSGFPAWAIVLIVLLILGAAGGGAYYYLKMRRDA